MSKRKHQDRTQIVPVISDAVLAEGFWCDGKCPHLTHDGRCDVLGELDYEDGILARCVQESEESEP